ncbi:hypothetical protein GEMRC1_012394 [Eukaryota sp. GEM-RC1]
MKRRQTSSKSFKKERSDTKEFHQQHSPLSETAYDSDEEIRHLQELTGWKNGQIPPEFEEDGLSYLLEVLPEFRGDKSLSDLDSDLEEELLLMEQENSNLNEEDSSSEADSDNDEEETSASGESDFDSDQNPADTSSPIDSSSPSDTSPPTSSESLSLDSLLNEIPAFKSKISKEVAKKIKGLFNRAGTSNFQSIGSSIAKLIQNDQILNFSDDFSNILLQSLLNPNVTVGSLSVLILVIVEICLSSQSRVLMISIISKILKRFDFLSSFSTAQYGDNLALVITNHIKAFVCFYYAGILTEEIVSDCYHFLIGKCQVDFESNCFVECCHALLRRVGKDLRSSKPVLFLNIFTVTHEFFEKFETIPIEIRILLDLVNALKNGKSDLQSVNSVASEAVIFDSLKSKVRKSGLTETFSSITFTQLLTTTDCQSLLPKSLSSSSLSNVSNENILVDLAKKKRLATSTRRAIFEAIVGSDGLEDSVDRLWLVHPLVNNDRTNSNAGTRLKHFLHDVAKVMVTCVCSEGKYNKFYAFLGEKLFQMNKEIGFGLQLAFLG